MYIATCQIMKLVLNNEAGFLGYRCSPVDRGDFMVGWPPAVHARARFLWSLGIEVRSGMERVAGEACWRGSGRWGRGLTMGSGLGFRIGHQWNGSHVHVLH